VERHLDGNGKASRWPVEERAEEVGRARWSVSGGSEEAKCEKSSSCHPRGLYRWQETVAGGKPPVNATAAWSEVGGLKTGADRWARLF
jgi:hypothetical protein